MKTLLLSLGLMFSTMTFASEVLILEVPFYGRDPYVSSEFKINKELGRAWVETHVNAADGDSDIGNDYYRVKVEGLSFNTQTSNIEYVTDGKIVECATVRRSRGLFKVDVIRPTGACVFSSKRIKVIVDDGFNTSKENRVQAFLTTLE